MHATLKTNLNRTVLLEQHGDAGVVIKRFHSPGALRRLTDGRRAAREFRVLTQLHELGLPVPKPIDCAKEGEHWEVRTEWIPGTVALDELLAEPHKIPAEAGDLPRRLGESLARFWSAGLDHSDLHAGNVLLDESGQIWLIDFQHARVNAELSARQQHRTLVALTAGVRELVSPRLRARFLVALFRGLKSSELEAHGTRTLFAKRIEEEARLHHRYRVRRRQLRWTRESSSCRAFSSGPVTGWVSRSVETEHEPEVAALAQLEFDDAATTLENGFELLELENSEGNWLIIRAQDEAVLREAWYTAVRVRDHGLPAPQPLLYVEAPQPRMLLLEEESASTLESCSESANIESLMHLLGSLHDRGLALADLSIETIRWHTNGPSFGSPLELVSSSEHRRARDRKAALELLGDSKSGSEEWTDAYCSAWRGDQSELASLREELARD